MDEMNRVSDFVDVFLRDIYTEKEGWTCWEFPEIGGYTPDYVFELDENAFTQIVVRVPESIINEEHIKSSKDLLALFHAKFPGKEVNVLLACGELLLDPPELPENILAVSIFEEAFGTLDPTKWEHSLN